MKQGENEAKQILGTLGIELIPNDDNSESKMPDFITKDNLYFEITHTSHNFDTNPTKYEKKNMNGKSNMRFLKNEKEVSEAISKINLGYYNKKSVEYIKDIKLIREHLGFDFGNPECSNFEFSVNHRCYVFDSENIIKKIKEKNRIHHDKENISLFCFATVDEVSNFYVELNNNARFPKQKHLEEMDNTVFKTIYM